MANFLEDYSRLNAAAGAFKGFSEAMEAGEDRKMKKMELDAHLKAQEDQRQRQATIDKLSLQKEGYTQGADGSLQEAELTPRQKQANMLKEFSEGAKPKVDEMGNTIGYELDQNSLKAKETAQKAATANAMMGMRGERLEETKNQNAAHAGQEFENDPLLKQMKNTRLSLSRARDIMHGKTPVTAQNLVMLQQDLINATAPGGAATEGKVNRELVETYAAKLNEIQSKFGSVKDLRKEQPQVFAQLEGLMKQMDAEYSRAMATRAQDIGGSYKYSTNKKVQQTVNDKVGRYAEQPEGLLAQPQGLIGQKPGLIGGPPPEAPQDPDAVKYAQMHGLDYPSALAIVTKRRAGL